MEAQLAATRRRGFLKGVAAAAAALVAGKWSDAGAETLSRLSKPDLGDAWVKKIHGRHRQVFDAVEPNNGLAAAYALNYIDSYKQAHSTSDSDITAVVSYRHLSMPLTLDDATWKKYKIGELINVTDPATKAPATRNIFRDNIMMRPGLTYEALTSSHPVVITACNMALTVLSGMAASKAGVTAEQAKADWVAGLLPGVNLVPSGVYAVNRAQEAGCSYCGAG